MANTNAEKLLAAYGSGKATEEEKALVETWYLKFSGPESEISHKELLEDKNRSLTALLAGIKRADTRHLLQRIGVAASVLLVVLAALFYVLYDKEEHASQHYAQLSDVTAGGNKATLTLANGKKIDLTSAPNGSLAELTGARINKSDGQVVYTIKYGVSGRAKLEYNKIETPNGGQYQVILPDGTIVYLNAASSITYPTLFSGKERVVEVVGEAYLEVAHRKNKPFKVISLGQVVEVLGTRFNVSAYKDEHLIKTTLLQGAVKITSSGKTIGLVPGEQAQVNAKEIVVTNDINPREVIAWKDGYFVFNESLQSIMNKIARWYDVEVQYQPGVDLDQAFGGRISRSKKLSSALKIMELTGNIHFKIEGRRVTVMK